MPIKCDDQYTMLTMKSICKKVSTELFQCLFVEIKFHIGSISIWLYFFQANNKFSLSVTRQLENLQFIAKQGDVLLLF